MADAARRPATAQLIGRIAAQHPAEPAHAAQPSGLRPARLAPPRQGQELPAEPGRVQVANQVIDRREQARVPGDAAEQARVLVVHDPGQRGAVRLQLGRRHRGRPGARPEAGPRHLQRTGDKLGHAHVERGAGNGRHDPAQQHESDVRVDHPGPRRVLERRAEQGLAGLVRVVVASPERDLGRQPRGMGEQLAHGDHARPSPRNAARNLATRSSSASAPSSARRSTAGSVAVTLVTDARSNSVSRVMARRGPPRA